MKRYRVKNVQFWISEHDDYIEIHFEGTNELKDILQWPWPQYGFTRGVSAPVYGAFAGTSTQISKRIERYVSGNKKLVITGFSWGCTLAYLHAESAYSYRQYSQNEASVYCILDDPPRFFHKEFKDHKFEILVWYKGRSIVHHVPFACMGYKKHLTGNYREIPSKRPWYDVRALVTDHYKIKIPRYK